MPEKNKIATLAEITTDILLAEIGRRAKARMMTVEQLLDESDANWKRADDEIEKLSKLGHEEK